MNQTPHDPNSLAEELDRVLLPNQSEQAATSSDLLVETALRLSAAPRPALSFDALTRIHATVQAVQMSAPPATRLLSRRFLHQSAPFRLATVAALVLIFVTGAIFAARIGIQLLNPTTPTPLPPTPTVSIAPTTPIPTQLPQLALTNQPPTSIPIEPLQLTPTNQPPTSIPTEPPQLTPTKQPTTPIPTTLPTASPTNIPGSTTPVPTLPVTIVIEGPVQAINGNLIVIFDLTIEINLSDPVLPQIAAGNMVRIEGNLSGDGQVITAIQVTLLEVESNVEVIVNPADGQVWQDPGNCSNPPPPWAPANGWRRRCQGQNPNITNDNRDDDRDDDEDDD